MDNNREGHKDIISDYINKFIIIVIVMVLLFFVKSCYDKQEEGAECIELAMANGMPEREAWMNCVGDY
jgi:hypothetical protein